MQFGKTIEPDTFRLERTLKAPIARVWAYFTEAEKRSRWFNAGDDITHAGQLATLQFGHFRITNEKPPERWAKMACEEVPMQTRILAFEPPHLLEISWGDGDEKISHVRFEFTALGDETLLVLTHSRVDTRANLLDFAGGWTAHLQTLADHLEGKPTNRFWADVVKAHEYYEGAAS
jgi:uncharacterized protein YndB with AHSA1/START domain